MADDDVTGSNDDERLSEEFTEGSVSVDIDLVDMEKTRQRFATDIDVGIESILGVAETYGLEYVSEIRKEFMKNGDQLLTNLFNKLSKRGVSVVQDRMNEYRDGEGEEEGATGELFRQTEKALLEVVCHVVAVERSRLESEVARMREDHMEQIDSLKGTIKTELEREGLGARPADTEEDAQEKKQCQKVLADLRAIQEKIAQECGALGGAVENVIELENIASDANAARAIHRLTDFAKSLNTSTTKFAQEAQELARRGFRLGSESQDVEEIRQYYEDEMADLKDSVEEMLIERENQIRKRMKAEKDDEVRKLESAMMAYREKEVELVNALHDAETKLMSKDMLLGKTTREMEDLQDRFARLQAVRKKLFNQVQELKGNIRVFCRVRPMFPHKGEKRAVVEATGDQELCFLTEGSGSALGSEVQRKQYEFDAVFAHDATQDSIFSEVESLVTSVVDGYNVCIFAYGQTGSGKTHTMQGGPGDQRGLNMRALERLFRLIDESQHLETELRVSIQEIYNETIRDLLSNRDKMELKRGDRGMFCPGLEERVVKSVDEIMDVMETGARNRSTGATSMNVHSSRSHLIVTIHTTTRNVVTCQVAYGKLHMVDLAGSERLSRSEATGERRKETQHINKSLSALGDVIQALMKKDPHIPYRNSKLTYLLQDSLGGDSKTLMFANLSPADIDGQETLSTINFAARVRNVILGPATRHKETGDAVRMKAQLEAKKLEKEKLREASSMNKKVAATVRALEDKDKLAKSYERDAKKWETVAKELKGQMAQLNQAAEESLQDAKYARDQAVRAERELKLAQSRVADLKEMLKSAGIDPGPDPSVASSTRRPSTGTAVRRPMPATRSPAMRSTTPTVSTSSPARTPSRLGTTTSPSARSPGLSSRTLPRSASGPVSSVRPTGTTRPTSARLTSTGPRVAGTTGSSTARTSTSTGVPATRRPTSAASGRWK
eukprot:Rmarinus@m.15216